MEYAYFITNSEQIKNLPKRCDRIYFGSELNGNLIPSVEKIKEIVESSEKNITLVTPFLTEEDLEKLKALLKFAQHCEKINEIVVNDFGAIRLISREYPSLKIIAGRLLIKQKTDPRHHYKSYANKESSLHTSLSDIEFIKILKKFKIERAEINNTLQGALLPKGFEYSLYYPYVLVALKRPKKMNNNKLCATYHSKINNNFISNDYALFYENKKVNYIFKSKINRVIIMRNFED